MKAFTDTNDRTWEITLNVAAMKRVRDAFRDAEHPENSVDLLDVLDGKLLERLSNDPILLCDILYLLIKPQADAQGITDEDFGAALGGDAIDDATTALLEELVNFSRRSRRAALRTLLAKIDQLEAKVSERVIAEIDSGRLDQMLEQELEQALNPSEVPGALPGAGSSSGSARASPASTPTP